VARVSRFADGIVIAGALARQIESLPEDDLITGVSDFVRMLKEATLRQRNGE
jgi:hypothetical protein